MRQITADKLNENQEVYWGGLHYICERVECDMVEIHADCGGIKTFLHPLTVVEVED